jgi:hypothetical protein
MTTPIVMRLLDHKIDRIRHLFILHLQGETKMGSKTLIYMGIYPEIGCEVTDSGQSQNSAET